MYMVMLFKTKTTWFFPPFQQNVQISADLLFQQRKWSQIILMLL